MVIPAYNEGSVICSTLAGLSAFLPRVVVIDDGSNDRTAELARACGAVVVRHAVNLGQGAALRTGIEFALHRGATHVCTFDADGQHDPASIAEMMTKLKACEADVALGSRFLDRSVAIPVARRCLIRAAVAFTRLHTRLRVSDTHNGLRVFTRAAARAIELRQLRMAHSSEILSEIARLRLKFVEVATTVTYTEYSMRKGQSLTNSFKILLDLFYNAWTSQRRHVS